MDLFIARGMPLGARVAGSRARFNIEAPADNSIDKVDNGNYSLIVIYSFISLSN